MTAMKPKGHLFILSGPSGVGKTVAAQQLLERIPELERVITFTTRPPRPGEENGVDYHFVDEATFQKMIDEDAFLEWALVHGHRYGTPKHHILQKLAEGRQLLMVIDVQGAMNVRSKLPEFHLIFLQPEVPEDLLHRLQTRKAMTEEEKQLRLANATREMGYKEQYDFVVTNKEGRLEEAVAELEQIVQGTIKVAH